MIDTHCHLDHKQFDADRAAASERAFQSGMEAIIVPAIEPSRFDGVRALVDSDARIFCGMGVHPHHALEATDEVLSRVEELSHGERVRAIGEIGLDYHYDFAPRDVQQDVFRKQLRIAARRGLPVIIHNRESDEDLFRILGEEQEAASGALRGVLHCFSGTPEQAQQAIDLGFHVSFTGNITFKSNAALAATVAAVPEDRFMIETDAPYMAPVPHRGKRNEPAFVRLVADKIAEIRSTSLETVMATTSTTAKRLFNLLSLALVLMALMATSALQTFAQRPDEEADDEPAPYFNPFKKILGIGASFGNNQLVEARLGQSTVSNTTGALAAGGHLTWWFSDAFGLQGSYLYCVNVAITRTNPATGRPYQDNPNYHQAGELSLMWNINPTNRTNFFLLGGGSYLQNSFNALPYRSFLGFHGGLGVGVNISTPIGIIYPAGEIRVSAAPGLNEEIMIVNPDPKMPAQKYTQTGFNYVIVRAGIHFFPKF